VGRALHDGPDVFWSCSGVPVAAANAILGGRFADEDDGVENVLSHFDGFPVDWEVAPVDVTPGLCAALMRRGYAQIDLRPAMLRSLADAPVLRDVQGCMISQVRGADDMADMALVMSEAFLMQDSGSGWLRYHRAMGEPLPPPYVQLVARVGGEPVAAAAMMPHAGVAGIYAVGVRTAWRARGLGAAITLAALDEGRRRGCHTAMLQATPAGLPVYQKLGFRVVCQHEVWSDSTGT